LETWFEKKGFETFLWIWNDVHPSPFEFSRAAGIFSRRVIWSSLKRRLANMPEQTIDIFAKYIHLIHMKPKGSEASISVVLAPFAYAKNPLVRRIKDLGNLPITFLYGEFDWMERETAEDLVNKKMVNGRVFSVSDSGHHLYIENPVQCVADILLCTHDENTANLFISSNN
jgi:pimeloyl-ACP methyl ester carboxylesterase